MSVEVRVPQAWREAVEGAPAVHVDGATVAAAIDALGGRWPALRERLLDDSGLRRFVNVYVGGSDVRLGAGLATALADGDVLTVLWLGPSGVG